MKSNDRTHFPSKAAVEVIDSPPTGTPDNGFYLGAGPGRPIGMLHAGQAQVTVRLARIGTDSLLLAAESVGLNELQGRRCQLYVPEADVTGLAGRLTPRSESTALFEIENPTLVTGARLLALIAERTSEDPNISIPPPSETIDRLEGVHSILRGLIVNNAPARIRAQGADWILRADEVLESEVVWRLFDRGGAPTSPLMIEAAGYSASYRLPVLLVAVTDTDLRTTIPKSIERVRRRRMPRVSARGELVARFIHPTYSHPVECPIVDVSDHGIGLQTDYQSDLLCPGLVIPDLVVLRHGREMAQLHATVRTVSLARGKAGVTVHPADRTANRIWSRLVR